MPISGDLAQPGLGVSEEDLLTLRGEVDHFFHLAAIYDMTAGAEAQEIANVEGTRHAVELAGAIEAGCFHQVSSIAAAGLYKGEWREDMFEEAERLDTHPYFRTKHESERVVREECARPWRVYRPGIVVGDSRTGEIDKVDGPYYFFKLLQQARRVLPAWLPTVGIEGGEINIVPVDYVADAIDHIAHKPGLDGQAFSLTDPNPKTAGEMINLFARAADAPQAALRLDSDVTDPATSLVRTGLRFFPPAKRVAKVGLDQLGIPAGVLSYVNYPTHFDSTNAEAALAGSGISVPPLESYADRVWDYWERTLDPDLFKDRTPERRGARQGGADHRRLLGDRQGGRGQGRRRRRDGAAGRALGREAGGDQSARSRPAAASPTSTAATWPTSRTSSGWPRRSSPTTARSTSSSTTPAARSAARWGSPTTASTTTSARSSSTTSARCG